MEVGICVIPFYPFSKAMDFLSVKDKTSLSSCNRNLHQKVTSLISYPLEVQEIKIDLRNKKIRCAESYIDRKIRGKNYKPLYKHTRLAPFREHREYQLIGTLNKIINCPLPKQKLELADKLKNYCYPSFEELLEAGLIKEGRITSRPKIWKVFLKNREHIHWNKQAMSKRFRTSGKSMSF